MNAIARLEFLLAYFEASLQLFSYYTTEIFPRILLSQIRWSKTKFNVSSGASEALTKTENREPNSPEIDVKIDIAAMNN